MKSAVRRRLIFIAVAVMAAAVMTTGVLLGVDIYLHGRYERSAVQLAMLHPDADVIRAMIEAGLKPRLGQDALVTAIETGETRIAHLFVDAGVDPNCHPGALTPLLAAIEARDVAMMTYLEEHGAREKP